MDAFAGWSKTNYALRHANVTKMLLFTAFIPPSMAEVEWTFSLLKLISTSPRKSLTSEHISHCMRISKYGQLNNHDYDTIWKKWLDADDTKLKTRKVSCLFEKRSKIIQKYFITLVINVT